MSQMKGIYRGLKNTKNFLDGCTLRGKISDLKMLLSLAWQRAWYGYDWWDVCSFANRNAERVSAIISDLKEIDRCEYLDPGKSINGEITYLSDTERHKLFDDLIYGFSAINDERVIQKELFGRAFVEFVEEELDCMNPTIKQLNAVSDRQEEIKNNTLDLFKKYYFQLWI